MAPLLCGEFPARIGKIPLKDRNNQLGEWKKGGNFAVSKRNIND